ncbi:hypothetical protein ASZ90_018156 [hydrocarbon metagenome]|uniref:Uncharacterized protein n=1 Tax=hydrocarbon metagenome TaxID=938273 RepID=A0A0W8E6Y4_9ZZZZ
MTNFLPAGMINETLEDICKKINELKEQLAKGDTNNVMRGLKELEDMTLDLWVFIEKFACQPLIYTGAGNTEEIIKRLEWALAFSEEVNPMDLLMLQQEIKKKAAYKSK